MNDDGDFATMNDPEFLAERRRVRTLLERTPEHEVSAEMRERCQRLDDEFIRRARAAWQDAS
jgi:hypothetical protein